MPRKRTMLLPPLLLLVLLAGLPLLPAQQHPANGNFYQQKFAEANQAYETADFAKARQLYEELLHMDLAEASVYYNLGNTFTQLGQTGRAVWAYERALRLEPRNEEIRYNLLRVKPKSAEAPEFVLFSPFIYARDRLTLNEWALLFSGCWFLVGLLLLPAGFLDPGAARSAIGRAALAAGLLLFASGAFLTGKYFREYNGRRAVVLDSAISRSGPSMKYKEHVALPAGQLLQLREDPHDREWVEFRLPGSARTSYVQADKIGVL